MHNISWQPVNEENNSSILGIIDPKAVTNLTNLIDFENQVGDDFESFANEYLELQAKVNPIWTFQLEDGTLIDLIFEHAICFDTNPDLQVAFTTISHSTEETVHFPDYIGVFYSDNGEEYWCAIDAKNSLRVKNVSQLSAENLRRILDLVYVKDVRPHDEVKIIPGKNITRNSTRNKKWIADNPEFAYLGVLVDIPAYGVDQTNHELVMYLCDYFNIEVSELLNISYDNFLEDKYTLDKIIYLIVESLAYLQGGDKSVYSVRYYMESFDSQNLTIAELVNRLYEDISQARLLKEICPTPKIKSRLCSYFTYKGEFEIDIINALSIRVSKILHTEYDKGNLNFEEILLFRKDICEAIVMHMRAIHPEPFYLEDFLTEVYPGELTKFKNRDMVKSEYEN